MLDVINTGTPEGFRDLVIIFTLLDSGLMVTELATLQLDDLRLEEGILKVMGKGNRERLILIEKQVRRYLHRYLSYCRPEPASPRFGHVFLNADGRPLSRNRIRCRMAAYGRKASLRGVRVSPHTLRHTAAVTFLRNGGDVFSLQRLLGHSSLEMTRHYCELADVDLKRAHATASPVDNLIFPTVSGRPRYPGK
ncbi:tyrosine-type recombinase/integrase [Chloroflexota bacterium]